MQHAGYRTACAGADIGGGSRDSSSGREPAEQRGSDIGNALGDELAVGAMSTSGHAIGNHRRKQAFQSCEEGSGQGRGNELAHLAKREMR